MAVAVCLEVRIEESRPNVQCPGEDLILRLRCASNSRRVLQYHIRACSGWEASCSCARKKVLGTGGSQSLLFRPLRNIVWPIGGV
jgi:hypothetical protein